MSMELARELAAQLTEEFAIILNKAIDEPRLRLATTGELLDELRARCEVDGTINYKTVGGG